MWLLTLYCITPSVYINCQEKCDYMGSDYIRGYSSDTYFTFVSHQFIDQRSNKTSPFYNIAVDPNMKLKAPEFDLKYSPQEVYGIQKNCELLTWKPESLMEYRGIQYQFKIQKDQVRGREQLMSIPLRAQETKEQGGYFY